jgi:hypothetical protein
MEKFFNVEEIGMEDVWFCLLEISYFILFYMLFIILLNRIEILIIMISIFTIV